jgi:hypothetical protein
LAALGKREPKTRTQVITPRAPRKMGAMGRSRRRNRFNLGTFGAMLVRFAGPLSIIPVLLFCLVGYNLLTRSKLFAVRNVHVSGASQSVAGTVEQVVRKTAGSSRLLDVSLPAVRQQIEALPRIHTATVSRTLPDTISVDVAERQPVILIKRDSGAIVWLDTDSVELGDVSAVGMTDAGGIPPPIATGFAEGTRSKAAVADDMGRIAKYKELEQEFDPSVWKRINEIELAYYDQEVSVQLVHPAVWVKLGKHDYRHNMDVALMVLEAMKRGDVETLQRLRVQNPEQCIKEQDNVKYIDAARPERLVMNFSTGAAQKAGKQESLVGKPPGRRRR